MYAANAIAKLHSEFDSFMRILFSIIKVHNGIKH